MSAFVAAFTTRINLYIVLVVLLVVFTGWMLWRTAFGLRLRSCGENPGAAESLGVNVYRYKYIAVIMSGAFAGIGGGFLALVASSGFNERADRRPRVHRPRRDDLRQLAPRWDSGRSPSVRLHGQLEPAGGRHGGARPAADRRDRQRFIRSCVRYRGGHRNAAAIMGLFGLAFLAWLPSPTRFRRTSPG